MYKQLEFFDELTLQGASKVKKKFKTTWTAAFSIALKNFADQLLLSHPQGNPAIVDDLNKISELSINAYSVEIIVNYSADDDKESYCDKNL